MIGKIGMEGKGLKVIDKPVEVTDATFLEFKEKYPLAVVDFWHPWCEPCKALHPVIDELAREYAGKCVFGKFNIGKNGGADPDLLKKYQIIGTPLLVVFKNGVFVEYLMGLTICRPSIIRYVINYHLENQ